MKRFFKSVAKAMMALMLVAVIAPAQAADLASSKATVSGLADKAIAVISDKSLSAAQRKTKFSTLLGANFDVPTIGKFALGRYWRQATPAQQKEYTALFRNMIVNVYTARFEEYSGQTVTVTGGRVDEKSGDVVVNSQINTTDGSAPVPVDWRLRNGKIIDVIVTGVSMSVTQRDDFASVIQQGGGKIEALLAHLRTIK